VTIVAEQPERVSEGHPRHVRSYLYLVIAAEGKVTGAHQLHPYYCSTLENVVECRGYNTNIHLAQAPQSPHPEKDETYPHHPSRPKADLAYLTAT